MVHVYNSFDLFVKNLSYWSSWSTGMAIWKSDFENIPKDMIFNELFPHTTILFRERNRNKYIIDNTIIMYELPTGNIAKGKYDWFGAFGIEYPGILCDLLREGSISSDTFRFVADKNLEFISESYVHFFIRRKPCSYDLSGLNNMFGVYYTKGMLYKKITKCVVNKICRKFKKH
jgi:hypothetical protein